MTTKTTDTRIGESRWRVVGAAAAAGFVLYALTCAPGVLWQDSAMFQYRVYHLDVSGKQGLPLAHPLYILLARAFCCLPLGEFAFRVNLFSALCGAAALAFAMDLLWSVTGSRRAAFAGTTVLAVSHTFWTHAVLAEVYDLYAVGLLAELWLLERFMRRNRLAWLAAALMVNGLNLSNHLLAILHWPAYAGLVVWLILRGRMRRRQVPWLAVALLVGCAPYLALVLARIAGGEPVFAVAREALLGPPSRARFVLIHSFGFLGQLRNAVLYFGLNFPTPLILAAPIGLWAAWRDARWRWFAVFVAAVFGIGFVFAFRYLVPDQFVFYMPCYVLAALMIGLGVKRWTDGKSWRAAAVVALALVPALVYEVAPAVMRSRGTSIGLAREIPYRDNYAYFIRPRKNGFVGAARFAVEALQQAGPDGLLYSDTTLNNGMIYVRDVLGVEPGVTLAGARDIEPAEPRLPVTLRDESGAAALEPFVRRGRAFITTNAAGYVPDWIETRYELVPSGVLYRLVEKKP